MAESGGTAKNEEKEKIKDEDREDIKNGDNEKIGIEKKEEAPNEGSQEVNTCLKHATIFGCIPLALFALIVGVALILSGFLNILAFVITACTGPYPLIVVIGLLVMVFALGFIQVLAGIWALLGTCSRSVKLMDQWVWIASRLLFWSIFSSILNLVSICGLNRVNAMLEGHEDAGLFRPVIQQLVLFLLREIVFGILSWWIIGCFLSLGLVFVEGGNGWECKNYIQIKAEKGPKKIDPEPEFKHLAALFRACEEHEARVGRQSVS